MAYIEDFLTNNCYRFISILLGFAFVFFTGIFDNSDRYYYLTPDQVIDNSTNYNDDDDMIYNNTNDNISYITVYDNSTIYRCEKILNSILHQIRNGNLLSLSSAIVMQSFKDEVNLNEIEVAYKTFAENLESEILKGIQNYEDN
jgi:hypothetical protein